MVASQLGLQKKATEYRAGYAAAAAPAAAAAAAAAAAGGDTTRCSVERITSLDQRLSMSPALTATAPETGGAWANWPVVGSRTCGAAGLGMRPGGEGVGGDEPACAAGRPRRRAVLVSSGVGLEWSVAIVST